MRGQGHHWHRHLSVHYGYDAGKRLVAVTSAASVVSYSYDVLNRITQVLSDNRTNAYTYLGNGSRVASLAHGNGMQTTYGYDLLCRLTNQATRTSGGEVLRSFAYAYNNADERIQLAREDGQVQDYGYDPISQLVSAKGNQPGYDFAYTYDPSGNPLRQNNNGYVLSNAFNNLNQNTTSRWSGTLTVQGVMNITNGSVTVNGTPATTLEGGAPATPFFAATNCPVVNGHNTYAAIITDPFGRTATSTVSVVAQNRGYGYDLNGNMTNDGQYSYAWDNADRLTEVRTLAGTLVMTCKYDGLSRRRERILWQDGVGQTNRYVYDGWLVLEIRDDGNHTLETYTHGPDLSSTRGGAGGIGGILSMSYSSPSAPCSMLYALYDGNGNILAATDTNQTLAAAFEYGPFGTLLRSSGPAADSIRYRFSSKEWDSPVGLYYYGFRYYKPELGRWINKDPIEEEGGINLNMFVQNSPVFAIDPYGNNLIFPEMPIDDPLCNYAVNVTEQKIWQAYLAVVEKGSKMTCCFAACAPGLLLPDPIDIIEMAALLNAKKNGFGYIADGFVLSCPKSNYGLLKGASVLLKGVHSITKLLAKFNSIIDGVIFVDCMTKCNECPAKYNCD